MFNAQITVMSLMHLSHMVTERRKVPERWCFITYIATVFQKKLICLFYLVATEPDLELSLKLPVSKHPVAEILIGQDRLRKDHL